MWNPSSAIISWSGIPKPPNNMKNNRVKNWSNDAKNGGRDQLKNAMSLQSKAILKVKCVSTRSRKASSTARERKPRNSSSRSTMLTQRSFWSNWRSSVSSSVINVGSSMKESWDSSAKLQDERWKNSTGNAGQNGQKNNGTCNQQCCCCPAEEVKNTYPKVQHKLPWKAILWPAEKAMENTESCYDGQDNKKVAGYLFHIDDNLNNVDKFDPPHGKENHF